MDEIKIIRTEETNEATLGKLYVNGEKIGYTLELPWENNKNNISCIPPGEYDAFIRDKNKSRWDYNVIQLKNVFKRIAIQIHIGNYPKDTNGCILVGKAKGKNAVWSSRDCFNELMLKIENNKIKVIVDYDN